MRCLTFFLRCWLVCLIVHLIPPSCALCAGLPRKAIIIPQKKAVQLEKYTWGVIRSKWVENIVYRTDDGRVYSENPSYGNFLFIKLYVENTTNEAGYCYPPFYALDENGTAFPSSNHIGNYLQVGNNLMEMNSASTAAQQILPGVTKECYMAFDLPNDRKYFLSQGSKAVGYSLKRLGIDKLGENYYFELVPQKISGKMSEASLLSTIDLPVSDNEPSFHTPTPSPERDSASTPRVSLGTRLKFKSGNLYFSPRIDRKLAEKAGNVLETEGFFRLVVRGNIQLDKRNDTILVRLEVPSGTDSDKLDQFIYFGMAAYLSLDAFGMADVEIQFCNERMETLRSIPLDPNFTKSIELSRKPQYDGLKLGTPLEFGKMMLFYTTGVSSAEAGAVGRFLVKIDFVGAFKVVQIDRKNDKFLFRMVGNREGFRTAGEKDIAGLRVMMARMTAYLSVFAFRAAPVEFHLCDKKLKPLMTTRMDRRFQKALKDLGILLEFPSGWVFVASESLRADGVRLGNHLEESGVFKGDDKPLFQLDRKNGQLILRREIKKGQEKDPRFCAQMKAFATGISRKVFNHAPIILLLCNGDSAFETLATLK